MDDFIQVRRDAVGSAAKHDCPHGLEVLNILYFGVDDFRNHVLAVAIVFAPLEIHLLQFLHAVVSNYSLRYGHLFPNILRNQLRGPLFGIKSHVLGLSCTRPIILLLIHSMDQVVCQEHGKSVVLANLENGRVLC